MCKPQHVMLDLETLATSENAVVISVGLAGFNEDGLTGPTLYVNFKSWEEQLDVGRVTDPMTIKWWAKQSPEAQKALFEGTENTRTGLSKINDFCTDKNVWGYGATFDNVIIRSLLKSFNLTPYWHYRNDMCFRTLAGLNLVNAPERTGTHHNALDDAIYQAQWASKILRILHGKKKN